MRIPLLATLITAAAVLGGQRDAPAQWDWNKTQARGLFGARELGRTLQPKPSSRFSNSFWRGPSGDFLGRDATRPGMMFPSPGPSNVYTPKRVNEMPPQITSQGLEYAPDFAPPQYPVEIVSGLPAAATEPAPAPPPPPAEEAPVISFRDVSPEGGSAEMATPANGATVAPGPGIALSGVAPTLSGGPPTGPLPFGLGRAGSIDVLMSNSLQSQIARMPRFQTGQPVRVSVSGGVATLEGAVPTQHDRKVLAEFVRMEPGIWTVNNQLTIQR